MSFLTRLHNSVLFWGAWIVIPVLMEIIPALVGVLLLVRRRCRESGYAKPAIYPEISVIVPVYNSQNTLYQCIESIHNSTYPNGSIHIFLVNNHTPDDSFSVYAKAQQEFSDLHMQWLNAEQGKSRALNLALYNSEGKYIVNLDSDGILEKNALTNMVTKFEARPDLNCMTGSILTLPDGIRKYKTPLGRLLRELEFMEYAQAFMAGRSYASETNSVYTLSGAFSAFRKSAVLSSRMYNTDTICEDTHMTFQIRQRQRDRVEICEDAVFFVDPIEDVNKLYTQRQRWQRGSLEVAKMFMDKNFRPTRLLTDISVRTLLYDHTFAFPRMIWYLAMLCLMYMNYSAKVILFSAAMIFAMYTVVGYFYFATVVALLKFNREIRRYYLSRWWCVALLPLFNLAVFFIRMAGIINSISTNSSWRTKNLTEEWSDFTAVVRGMCARPVRWLQKLRGAVNRKPEAKGEGEASNAFLPYDLRWYLSVGLLYLVSALLILAVYWSRRTFGVEIGEIAATLSGPVEGAGAGMVNEIVTGFGIPLALILAVIATVAILCRLLGRRHRRRKSPRTGSYRALHGCVLSLGVLLLLSGTLYANAEYKLLDYYTTQGSKTTLYEDWYVAPETVAITAPAQKKNLIYIYVESLETTYASAEHGGIQQVNYMPRLTRLARENLNFSDTGTMGGFHSLPRTTWTMAALLASTSGVPYGLPSADVTLEEAGYLPGLKTVGDVLAENGYNQEFLCGSNGHFAGRQEYFELHGGYEVFDLYAARRAGYVEDSYMHGWGLEDKILFDIARDEATRLAALGEPFNLTLLTVDLHAPGGYVCRWCGKEYEGNDTATVCACSDRLVGEFVEWCKTQDFYEDTVIIITGDHPRMDTNLVAGADYYDRTVYNCFINSAAVPAGDVKSRSFTTMDMFPTTLSALGFDIEGDRLGLGADLFSGEKTLLERGGADWLSGELSKASEYFMKNFALQGQ